MNETKKSNKKIIWGAALIIAAIALFAGIYFLFGAKPVSGSKNITIEVVDNMAASTFYEVKTEAEFLRQAMEEAKDLEFSGDDGDYGLMVDTINGIKADYNADGTGWTFYVNGEYCNYGIDTQPVMDGDNFKIAYEVITPQ